MIKQIAMSILCFVGGIVNSAPKKETSSMKPLSVQVSPMIQGVIAGEQLHVVTVLKNNGSDPVVVPDIRVESRFEYELISSEDDKKRRYKVSYLETIQRLAGDDVLPPLDVPSVTLAPGEEISVKDDIMSFSVNGFLPGNYSLRALFQSKDFDCISEPVQLTIRQPDISRIGAFYCPISHKWTALFQNENGPGDNQVYIRETHSKDPTDGTAICLGASKVNPPIHYPTPSLEAPIANNKGRWNAWIEAGKLRGVRFFGLPYRSAPVAALPISDPAILSPGFQLADQSAVFLLAGESNNKNALAAYKMDASATKELFLIPLDEPMPESTFLYIKAEGKSHLVDLIWIKRSNHRHVLNSMTIRIPDGTVITKTRELFAIDGSIFAASLKPIPSRRHPAICNLVVSGQEEEGLKLVQIDLDKPGTLLQKSLPSPLGAVEQWAVCDDDSGIILAKSAGYVLYFDFRADMQWKTLAHAPEKISSLRLFSIDMTGERFAQWISSVRGFSHAQIP